MKIVIPVLIIMLFVLGCKKDKVNHTIVGTWELRTTYGGWTGEKQYKPGNGNLAIFTENNKLTKKVVNTDTSYNLLYKYSLMKEDDCGLNLFLQSADDNYNLKQRAIISYDTLTISDGCIADGSFFVYVKQ